MIYRVADTSGGEWVKSLLAVMKAANDGDIIECMKDGKIYSVPLGEYSANLGVNRHEFDVTLMAAKPNLPKTPYVAGASNGRNRITDIQNAKRCRPEQAELDSRADEFLICHHCGETVPYGDFTFRREKGRVWRSRACYQCTLEMVRIRVTRFNALKRGATNEITEAMLKLASRR
jgi:hypothetical protein